MYGFYLQGVFQSLLTENLYKSSFLAFLCTIVNLLNRGSNRQKKLRPMTNLGFRQMTDNMLGQENKPTELRNEKTDSLQVNFVGWGGAILSLLSVIFAMKSTTIQNEFFAISLFVAGVSLSIVALQFKPRWPALIGMSISCVAFFFLSSLIGL